MKFTKSIFLRLNSDGENGGETPVPPQGETLIFQLLFLEQIRAEKFLLEQLPVSNFNIK